MKAYWADLTLFFQRAAVQAGRPPRRARPVGVHRTGLEERRCRERPRGRTRGLPQNAAGFAQEIVKLRDRLAPNVILAYHMSGWGTQHDVAFEDPPDHTVVAYATRSAAFYKSLGAAFDLSFEDFSDRDSGYYEKVRGEASAWFKPADFHRHLLYGHTFVRLAGIRMAAWQIPLGNTVMRAMNDTTGHYQDNRVQWLLRRQRPEAPSRLRQGRVHRLPVRRRVG